MDISSCFKGETYKDEPSEFIILRKFQLYNPLLFG